MSTSAATDAANSESEKAETRKRAKKLPVPITATHWPPYDQANPATEHTEPKDYGLIDWKQFRNLETLSLDDAKARIPKFGKLCNFMLSKVTNLWTPGQIKDKGW